MTSTAVRVGLRVRPLTEKEQINNCTECLSFIPNEPQILIGTDKSFTYDYVFGTDADQAQVYLHAASPLLHKFMDGFNATILAYGQTGSGKTFSMGTSLDNSVSAENEGIVPRCIIELFQVLKAREAQDQDYKFEIYVSFLELYNEEFIDLLNNPQQQSKRRSTSSPQNVNATANNNPNEVSIREDIAGNIYWSGVKEELCYSPEELLGFLAQGSLGRTTGSTEMNSVSSRSHAIFSVILKQQKPEDDQDGKRVTRSLTSKFHFVDLAGSERLKRTHAQGDRAKEGIAINSGLLALGNVISALGDETRRATHIPYRDSKLTRLLQDSLGGNSQTLMLACVSPADTNFMETLNTLKYANRARNIKNRVTVNQEFAGSSMEVNQLKALVSRLRMEIASLRAADGSHSTTTASHDVSSSLSNSSNSNSLSYANEVARLREKINDMSSRMMQVTSERDTLLMERELGEFMQNESMEDDDLLESVVGATRPIKTHPIIEKYLSTIQDLTTQLDDTKDKLRLVESHNLQLQKTSSMLQRFSTSQQQQQQQGKKKQHRGNGRSSANNSSTTNGYAARITTKVTARRPILTKSTSTGSRNAHRQKKHVRIKQPRYQANDHEDEDEFEEDEGYVNDLQEDDVRHEEVKESIAKVRADIRKSLQVLELVKPLDDTTSSWEEELKAFEAEEKRLHGCKEMQRTSSDEGRFSLTPSPTDEYVHEIETLAVPTWENDEHHARGSLAAAAEVSEELDDDFISIKSSTTAATSEYQSKYNSQLSRMLHQIQSDIKVKEELVSHLEKSETEFTFMRKKFDEKISLLQSQLADTQKEKDMALMRTKSGLAIRTDIANHHMQQQPSKTSDKDIRQAYETKMKNLTTEIQELRRKYAHATTTMQSTRNQNESLLRSLKVNVETLKVEKKRLVHRMKLEADRVRDQIAKQERRIQQLQRQHAKSNQAKRRLEREHEQQKSTLKKRNEEVLINATQVKQLTAIMKKAVREGGILDEKMLSKVTPIMGGSFAVIARGGGHGFPRRLVKKRSSLPLDVRVSRKKELLDKALYQYIQGKQAVVEMEQLLIRRERLVEEKLELEEERDQVYHVEKEHQETTGQPMDTIAIELMDERVDLITAEISYLSARIRTLQSEAAEEAMLAEENVIKHTSPRPPKHVTFADEIITEPVANDDWADVDTFEDQFTVPANAAPEMAYDITSKLIRSFESDECKRIIENLVDDIMDLRMSECNRQLTVQNLEKTVIDLRRTLIVMKRAAISSTAENERRIRHLKTSDSIAMDDCHSLDEYMHNGSTIFDKIYEDGVRGLIQEAAIMSRSPTSDTMYSSPEQQQQVSLPNSPVASPSYVGSNKPPLPVQMMESISKSTILPRESTPSPDRFYNMIQKRLSWQARVSGDETLTEEDELLRAAAAVAEAATTAASPPDFGHYVTDHDSSTSSIRSSHLRRSSIQSDMSSLSSWNQKSMNRISSTSNINVTGSSQNNTRRPQRTMPPPPPPPPMSPLLSHISPPLQPTDDHQSPLFTTSYQQQRFMRRPLPPLMPSVSTFERPTTPSVFDRLAQTPTRASRAKMNYRHSSSSVDDLRKRWEMDQQQHHQQRSASVMSDNYV